MGMRLTLGGQRGQSRGSAAPAAKPVDLMSMALDRLMPDRPRPQPPASVPQPAVQTRPQMPMRGRPQPQRMQGRPQPNAPQGALPVGSNRGT